MTDHLGPTSGDAVADRAAVLPAATPAERLPSLVAPASFADFGPVGSVMVGLPDLASAAALVRDLRQAGWSREDLRHFDSDDSVLQLGAQIDGAGPLAGFGFEITLLRRYLALAQEGQEWLLARVDDSDKAASVATFARKHGATLAVHYRALAVEELL
jgi:hypothetical protein